MPEEKLKIIRDAPTRYHFKTKDDQRVSIEYRDKGLAVGLHKWDEEASFEMDLNIVKSSKHQFVGNKVEIDTPAQKLRVYPIDIRSTGEFYGDIEDVVQCEDGGLRFELVLKAKPLTNSFAIPIKSKNLRFSKQPFLTLEDIDAGTSCPLNVEGSYAVYHATKKNNQYMTGKAFHIYRPIAEDALGNKAWCAIHIDGYIDPKNLTITIPQQFLDEATYPVSIDPDFGFTTIGASAVPIAEGELDNIRRGSAWAMPETSTANYIRAYIGGDAVCDCKAFINQKDSGGANTHGQIATKENLSCATAYHWEEFTLGEEALTEAVVYILNIMGNKDDIPKKEEYRIKYDVNGALAVASYSVAAIYDPASDPWMDLPDETTRDFSIYCNYGVEAPAALENKSANMGSKMVAAGLI
ncbi:hypothetical protein ES703_115330 [subsurface metagenome]